MMMMISNAAKKTSTDAHTQTANTNELIMSANTKADHQHNTVAQQDGPRNNVSGRAVDCTLQQSNADKFDKRGDDDD